ncbi:hypothetical protein JL720_13552 [Aureococcus anophagefferens]|nr:hypothetical protein JL720_13552 [Aureococcus anophagefferens]
MAAKEMTGAENPLGQPQSRRRQKASIYHQRGARDAPAIKRKPPPPPAVEPRGLTQLARSRRRSSAGRMDHAEAKRLHEAAFTPGPPTYSLPSPGPSGGRLACRSTSTWLSERIEDNAWVPGPGAHLQQLTLVEPSLDRTGSLFGSGDRALFSADANPGAGAYDVEAAERAMGVGDVTLAKIARHASRFHDDEVEEQRLAVLPSPFDYAPPSVASSRDLDERKRPGVRVRGREGARSEVDEMIKAQWWTPGVGSYGGIAFEGSKIGAALDRHPRSKASDHESLGPGPYIDVSDAYRTTLHDLSSVRLREDAGPARPEPVLLASALGRSPGPAYDTSAAYLATARSVPGLLLRPQHLVASKLDEKRAGAGRRGASAYFARLRRSAAPAPAPAPAPAARPKAAIDLTQQVHVAASRARRCRRLVRVPRVATTAKRDYANRNVRQTKADVVAKPVAFVPPPLPNAPQATASRATATAGKASAKEYERRYLAAFRACRDAELAYGMEAIPARRAVGDDATDVPFSARIPARPTRSSERERADRLAEALRTPELGRQDPRFVPDEERFWSAHVGPATPTRAARGDGDARGPDDGLDFTADGDDGRLSDSKWRKLLKNSRFIGASANAAVDEHGVVLPPKRRNAKELFRESAYKISRGGRG